MVVGAVHTWCLVFGCPFQSQESQNSGRGGGGGI